MYRSQNLGITEPRKKNNRTQTMEKEPDIFTSEWLRKNTEVNGWLAFMLLFMICGAILSTILFTKYFHAYSSHYMCFAVALSLIFSLILIGMSGYAVWAFAMRRPNAIFWTIGYHSILIYQSLLQMIFLRNYTISVCLLSIVWILYLLFSEQSKEVIPPEYRKVTRTDWAMLGWCYIIPLITTADFIIGTICMTIAGR